MDKPAPTTDGLPTLEAAGATLAALLSTWEARLAAGAEWEREPAFYRRLGEQAVKLGEPLLAYDMVGEGLEYFPNDHRLRQLQGLALARSGVTQRANQVLTELVRDGCTDAETLGILARTEKDLAEQAARPEDRLDHYRRALRNYTDAYDATGSPWAAINAATIALMLQDGPRAAALAREVRSRCFAEIQSEGDDRYYTLAMLGEAALILGESTEARSWYTQAASAGRGRLGDLQSTRRNALLLAVHLGLDRAMIDGWFQIPGVVVFVGHMIDSPGRHVPRFPPELESIVAREIGDRLVRMGTRIGFSSAACGSDILFLEAIAGLGAGNEAHVVLPYDAAAFVVDSVDIVPGGAWVQRFNAIVGRGDRPGRAEVITTSSHRVESGGTSYDFANRVLHGLAAIRARQLGTELKFLAVWDGRPGDGSGGTADAIAHWKRLGHEVEVIDLSDLLARTRAGAPERTLQATAEASPARPRGKAIQGSQVVAILFADVVGFSKLTESQIPAFVESFLGLVGDLVDTSAWQPLMKNTWGDGLYFTFENVRGAGLFALALCDRVATTDWAAQGLPRGLNLRVGMHAGPVYHCIDPVTKQPNSIGTHVSRAARIEPITPPGQVYASREFAAITAADRVDEFVCDYVGLTKYAKAYGTFPTYHVRPKTGRM